MPTISTKDINSLVKKLKKGNSKAAKELYQSFANITYTAVLHLVQDEALAQDLLQEAFIKAFKEIETLKEPAAFGGWIKRIAINLALQHQRKLKRTQVLSLNDTYVAFEAETEKEIAVTTEVLHQAIIALPDGCREVFRLYYLDDYSHKAIAEAMEISISTSKSQLHRAKSLLRASLKQHYYEY